MIKQGSLKIGATVLLMLVLTVVCVALGWAIWPHADTITEAVSLGTGPLLRDDYPEAEAISWYEFDNLTKQGGLLGKRVLVADKGVVRYKSYAEGPDLKVYYTTCQKQLSLKRSMVYYILNIDKIEVHQGEILVYLPLRKQGVWWIPFAILVLMWGFLMYCGGDILRREIRALRDC